MKIKAKKISLILSCLIAATSISCNSNKTPADSTTSERAASSAEIIGSTEFTTEEATKASPKRTVVAPETTYVTEDMYERAISIWPASQNMHRLVALMKKAEAGQPVTIGVIGGSITQRFHASSEEKSYAQILLRWWKSTFPDCEISYVNAGIGSTDSYLGVHRVDAHLLSKEPDFVVVEFSVNDSRSVFYQKCYENLVYKILSSSKDPAVLLLFMTQENGTSTQTSNIEVGKAYQLPMLSYRNAVLPAIEKGEFTWKDISPDNIHPNDRGHAICGELLWTYLNQIYENLDEYDAQFPEYSIPAKADYKYADATILDQTNLSANQLGSFVTGSAASSRFSKGWSTSSGDEAIEFTITCKNLGILYYKTTSKNAGQFEVYIDGEYKCTIDSSFPDGWGNYEASQELFSDDEAKAHNVRIKKAASSTGDVFSLLGWLVS